MKKIICLLSFIFLGVVGCSSFEVDDAVNQFKKDINNADSYLLKGTMEIINNEETFSYNIETAYQKDDYYKVTLINQTNQHEQIILKNPEGVYVITPSLNKSFKFQSDWPDNGSQGYILKSLLNDLINDDNKVLEITDNNYIIKTKVNYPNNPSISYEKIYFDKKMIPQKIEVFEKDNILKILIKLNKVDYKSSFNKDYFYLNKYVKEVEKKENNDDNSEEKETNKDELTNKLEDVIYPLYIPNNTYLSTKDVLNLDDKNRVILTFSGDKSFILVEEPTIKHNEFEVIPVYGDPLLFNDSLAALSANSLSWTSNNIDYYLSSSNLTDEEMLSVASSLTASAELEVGK